ncbi:MAG TPA: hypothetical protein VGV64_01360 [Thermoplasmata archaeon]|nr:hypothetical protein [Thermoplasmata archaeon]
MLRWRDGTVDATSHLERDETLLATGRPACRTAVLIGTALSIGVAQKGTEPSIRTAQALGLDVVPRASGGTGVVHSEGDLGWSIVLPRTHPLVGRDFSTAYARLGAGVVAFLGDLGLRAQWTEAPGLSESFCPLGRRGSALSVDRRVLGGAAQHATRDALLHQGIVQYTVDRPLLERLFDLDGPTLQDRLGSLRELAIDEPPPYLAERLLERLRETVALPG